jgi:hypothetical protein
VSTEIIAEGQVLEPESPAPDEMDIRRKWRLAQAEVAATGNTGFSEILVAERPQNMC